MKKILKLCISIIAMLFVMAILNTVSKAASFEASISSTKVKVGETFTVTVKANNAAGMYSVSSDNSNVAITDGSKSEFIENESVKITFKAKSVGKSSITAKATDMTDLDDDTKPVTGSKTFNVTVVEATTNTNTPPEPQKGTLSTVKINNITVKEFLNVTNKDSASVYVKTSNGESATIYNSLTKKSYTVKSGNTVKVQILEGTNTLTITLASGNKYTRKIYSQKEEETKPNVIEEPKTQEKVVLKSLSIKGIKSDEEKVDFVLTPEFSSEVYEYSLTIPKELNDITKLDVQAVGDKKEYTVEITGNEELVDGENIVTILVKSKDGENTATYQINVIKEVETQEAVAPVLDNEPNTGDQKDDKNQTIKIVIVALTVVIVATIIIFLIVKYKKGRRNDSNYYEDIMDNPMKFASVGFEKEDTDKEDVLGKLREDGDKVEEKPKKKGKHF